MSLSAASWLILTLLAGPTPAPRAGLVTYTRDIAPILQKHCVVCHRPGQVAPFSLISYRQAAAWAATIREVVTQGRMPPWHANPRHGKFANDPRFSQSDQERLCDWIDRGCPEGDPADLPAPVKFADDWSIPAPDQVLTLPQPFIVPAEGIVEYQDIVVDPGFREDKWVKAVEIRPGNRKVVHHCSVYLQPPECDEPVEQGALGSFCLAAWAPGTPPLLLPDGMAKLIPAGWRLVFTIHYTPIGTVQTDQTSVGLVFADPGTVKQEVATKLIHDNNLCIPPGAADHRVERTHQFDHDVVLLAFFPHMHFRGKSFRYEVTYPDGAREILLDVWRYDFAWQNRYVLAEPKHLPAGTTLHCIAHYDNSANNPLNPDPTATVRTGRQTWDEMFNGYFEWVLADQDLTRPVPLVARLLTGIRRTFKPVFGLIIVPVGLGFLLVNRCRQRRS
jgi:hypothetical protein